MPALGAGDLSCGKKCPQRKAGFKKPQKAGAERLRWERDKPCVCVANFQCVEASHSGRVMLKAVGLRVGRAEEVNKGGLSEGLRPCFIKAAFIALPG